MTNALVQHKHLPHGQIRRASWQPEANVAYESLHRDRCISLVFGHVYVLPHREEDNPGVGMLHKSL